ncbi:hypothetical protein PPH94_019445 [Burkholderia cepacia]|uniref:hypothetical protein n=1 Tax=Burkholderia cepacia TaxID=292 RepID=UPI00234A579B|nr:hypothetical protein [Burkholderia cepacia]MDC6099569.1 hypothetical protein [Burkholderia cepacia]
MFTGRSIVNFIIGLLAVIGFIAVLGLGGMLAMHAGMMHGMWSCVSVMFPHDGTHS